jgi:adenylosuccinate lyase
VEELAEYFSEYALIRARVRVECAYLVALSENTEVGMRRLTAGERGILEGVTRVSLEDAQIVKKIEREGHAGIPATNHDVKAVEYFIKGKLAGTSLTDVSEWTHFALTSEDINSVAYGLLLRDALDKTILPALSEIRAQLDALAREHAATPMLARTHGQSATPTTFGKEMRVFEDGRCDGCI